MIVPKILPLLAVIAALSLVAPAASAAPVSGASCTASDQTARFCSFVCKEGDRLQVNGNNANEILSQTFSASCGGSNSSCSAPRQKSCENGDGTANAAADDGHCQMEHDGEGSVTCSASGGTATPCLSDPVKCVCPPAVCGGEQGISVEKLATHVRSEALSCGSAQAVSLGVIGIDNSLTALSYGAWR